MVDNHGFYASCPAWSIPCIALPIAVFANHSYDNSGHFELLGRIDGFEFFVGRFEPDLPPTLAQILLDSFLVRDEGRPTSLPEYRGKWVVLYFYPKDFTSGCTLEARNFQMARLLGPRQA
jgi:AhpC/TSA family